MRKLGRLLRVLALVLGLLVSVRSTFATQVADDVNLLAELTGTTEVPAPSDADGSGAASIILRTGAYAVCWGIKVMNVTLPAAAAHIHRGAAGEAGPVVVGLSAPDANGDTSGCVGAGPPVIGEINTNPAAFYVNVHTTDFPGGAVRGQLAVDQQAGTRPATMPGTGAGSSYAPIAVLAALVLLAGFGLTRRAGKA